MAARMVWIFTGEFATEAKPFLKPDGKIMLEFGDGQADAIKKIFENEKWIVEAVKEDYSQRARILIARRSIIFSHRFTQMKHRFSNAIARLIFICVNLCSSVAKLKS